jgi:PAS domain S-box-containing protein
MTSPADAGEVHAEVALRASEQRFRDLAESIPHLIWSCAGDGACDYLSPQWLGYTGLPEAGQLGHGWLEQIHPADRDACRSLSVGEVPSGGVFDVQMRIRRGDGAYRWFQTRATPIRDDAGRITRWFGSSTDIQELRDAQAAMIRLTGDLEDRVLARTDELRAANAQIASVVGQLQVAQRIAQVGSWEWTVATQQVLWSEELYRIVGTDPAQPALDFSAQEAVYTPASWAALAAAVQEAVTVGDPYELALELVQPDGQRRTVIARGEALRGPGGAIEKLVGTLQDVTELAQVRTELTALSERMQIATSAANVGVWEWNLSDDTVVWDETMRRLYDIQPGELAGGYEAWRSRIHPDDVCATEAELRDAVAGERDFQTGFRIVRSNGEVRHLRPAAAVQRDPETGRPIRVVGVNWDVTEQCVAEIALRHSEAVQRGILAHAGSAIIATDCDGTFTLFNRAAEDLLGYTADEVLGKLAPKVFHDPEQVEARRAVLERELGYRLESTRDVVLYSARQGKPETHEWAYWRKDGSRVPVLLTVSALRDEAGEISGYLGVVADLSLRKQEEHALVELNRLLAERSAQAESANHAKSMFLANMSHEIRTPMNAITGLSYLLGRTALAHDQRELVQTLNIATKTLLGMINDVLDLSKIEARQLTLDDAPFQLSRVLDELGVMMAALAAEKRLELVVETEATVPEQLVGDAMRLTQILTNLVGNAIKFTEVGSVRLGVHRVTGADDRAWLRFEVRDTGAGIDDDMLPRLFTPFTQLEHPGARRVGGTGLGLAIVKELATLMGGEVGVVSTRGVGSEFWCRVPFARTAPASLVLAAGEERTEGVARGDDAALGTSLTGSTPFDAVTAARAARGQARAAAVDGIAGGQRLIGTRLLVVEDSKLNQIVVRRIMEREGARVETADDGLAAVARIASAPTGFDAVLMDVQMPELDGIAATRRIRGIAACVRLPIIAVTAGALAAERQLALDAGVNEVISKPFDPEVVVASVRKHIEQVSGPSFASPIRPPPRSAWPVVDGIDARDAAHRLGGDVALFRSLLGLFADTLDDVERSLSPTSAIDEALARRLHALRGTAGNLGARELHAAATEAERAVRAGDGPATGDAMRRVLEEVARLRRAIPRAEPTPPLVADPASASALDPVALTAFMQALHDHDMDASMSWFAHSPGLVHALGNGRHARMCDLLDHLEFEAALQIVRPLATPGETAAT